MANFLKKIQDLPEERKRIILWSIVALIALILFSWWFKDFKAKMDALKSLGSNSKIITAQEYLKSPQRINQ